VAVARGYIRQSTQAQVQTNLESQRRQSEPGLVAVPALIVANAVDACPASPPGARQVFTPLSRSVSGSLFADIPDPHSDGISPHQFHWIWSEEAERFVGLGLREAIERGYIRLEDDE
jgi:hypothetical protein